MSDGLIVELLLTWLVMFLAFLAILTFETWSAVIGGWTKRTFRVQDSAVLILNAEDGKCRN
jgi:hypothetical protein